MHGHSRMRIRKRILWSEETVNQSIKQIFQLAFFL